MSGATAKRDKDWKLAGSSWAGAWKVCAGLGALGLVGAGIGYTQDPRRFAFSWLFAFITVLMVALGALFFVIIQHLTSAGWSVTVRRTAEFFALGLVALVPLFAPVLLTMDDLFPWLRSHDAAAAEHAAPSDAGHGQLDLLIKPAYAQERAAGDHAHAHGGAAPAGAAAPTGEHASAHGGAAPAGIGEHAGAHDAAHAAALKAHHRAEQRVLAKKAPYLNRTFFLIRVAVYFIVWGLLAARFFGWSTSQDRSKDPKLTLSAQRLAPAATFLYGITLTFAVFDWVMSLEPMWFSTIFGVVMFSTAVVSSLAVIVLVTLGLRTAGPLEGAVTVEHFHDLGKLMFGFLVFWAYVSFSQYMLIWYAALPEETTFFHDRWNYEPWRDVSMAIILFHFVVPFFWTMSRHFKRNLGRLQIGAAIILVMHVVDIYWFVMPNFHLGAEGFSFHWLDVACLLGVAGVYSAFVFHRMTKFALVPIGDPRLARSLAFLNA